MVSSALLALQGPACDAWGARGIAFGGAPLESTLYR